MTGTRQQRISDIVKIRKRIPDLVGKKINVVLNDQRVLLGTIESVHGNTVVLKDMKSRKMPLEIAQLSEIYVDMPA
jgi:ferredoxin-fold anticodon binding domain-containing protein